MSTFTPTTAAAASGACSAPPPAGKPASCCRPAWPPTSFGEDEQGEIYLADQKNGSVYLLAAVPSTAVVVNAASGEEGISPGSVAAVRGTGLVPGPAAASGYPLPTALQGVSVTVNGVAAPLYGLASGSAGEQITFQVPNGLADGSTAAVVVSNNGVAAPAISVPVRAAQPGLFLADGVHAAAQHGADYALITTAAPAAPGEIIVLYGTGFGPLDNLPEAGRAAPVAPLSRTVETPLVTVAGIPAQVAYSGLTPGLAGVYQLNIIVPPNAPSGDADVVVTARTLSSRPARLPLR